MAGESIVVEACRGFLEPDHIMVSVNWPAESGCMNGVCSNDSDTADKSLRCVRGSVKELCQVSLSSSQSLQVNALQLGCWLTTRKLTPSKILSRVCSV